MHPSENPALGWLVPCLSVTNLEASLAFYEILGFRQYGGEKGGKPAEKWATLRNRANEIHLFEKSHIPTDMSNFRGGNPAAIRAMLADKGIEITNDMGPRSFIVKDPDGREVFFDSGEDEEAAYNEGQLLSLPHEGDIHAGEGIDLGNSTLCFNCGDLKTTWDWWAKLGYIQAGGQPDHGWLILSRPDQKPTFGQRTVETCYSLFGGMLPTDMLNFRGGNVAEIARHCEANGIDLGEGVKVGEDGGESILLTDPDKRAVYLDTTPPERLY